MLLQATTKAGRGSMCTQEHSAHRVRRKRPYINDAARNEYHHFSYFPPPFFLLADQQARPVTASDC